MSEGIIVASVEVKNIKSAPVSANLPSFEGRQWKWTYVYWISSNGIAEDWTRFTTRLLLKTNLHQNASLLCTTSEFENTANLTDTSTYKKSRTQENVRLVLVFARASWFILARHMRQNTRVCECVRLATFPFRWMLAVFYTLLAPLALVRALHQHRCQTMYFWAQTADEFFLGHYMAQGAFSG